MNTQPEKTSTSAITSDAAGAEPGDAVLESAQKGQLLSLSDEERGQRIALDINRKISDIEYEIKSVTARLADSHDQLDTAINALGKKQRNTASDLERVSLQQKLDKEQQLHINNEFGAQLQGYASQFNDEIKRADALLIEQEEQIQQLRKRQDELQQWCEELRQLDASQSEKIQVLDEQVNEKLQIVTTQYESLSDLHQEQKSELQALTEQHESLAQAVDRLGLKFQDAWEQYGLDQQALTDRVEDQSRQLSNVEEGLAEERDELRQQKVFMVAGLGALLLLLSATFIYLDMFTEPRISRIESTVTGFESARSQISEDNAALQQRMAELSRKVAQFEQSQTVSSSEFESLRALANDNQAALEKIAEQLAALESALEEPQIKAPKPTLDVKDAQWVSSQQPDYYTIQLVGSYQQGYLAVYINQHADQLQELPLSTNTSTYRGRDWFNLYYGRFADFDSALSALKALPPQLQQSSPWIRSFGAIQRAAK